MNTANPPLWAVLDLAEATQRLGNNERAIQLLVAAEKDNMSSKMLHYRLMRLYTFTNNATQAKKQRELFEQQSFSPGSK